MKKVGRLTVPQL